MQNVAMMVAVNLVSLSAVIGAVILASMDKQGWGWCLVVAVLAIGSVEFKKTKRTNGTPG